MTAHIDKLDALNQHLSLHDKIISIHKTLSERYPFIVRIAIAIYDPKTGLLKTFIHSSDEHALEHYQAHLDEVPSLKAIIDKGLPRVINNFLTFEHSDSEHTQRIGRQGYLASYTLPIFNNGDFFGFLFFNSNEKNVFSETILQQIDIYGHLIALMVINESNIIQTLSAAVKTTGNITHIRDPETGSHLDRMSRYSRLIAIKLADQYQLSDDFIEHLFMFAPLHDIGKIGIPDEVLLKPGKLNHNEKQIMQSHSVKGRKIIDDLLKNFELEHIEYSCMLRNIIEYHHESIDGNGYPNGIKGEQIPIESRIVAVADVFDALTSVRPYKKAWSNGKAFDLLAELAGQTLDANCVNALLASKDEIDQIQQQFKENFYG
ncbi:transcriptional regulator [Thalassotalea insulae]|uniref:Transcriptional regulator n=1 Tax=Thalassotalea insulae TaxID=2056778 RepID=A0ABQ6GV56_9GAMM|nr:HD domain-containing phosphohydrolase [Thalassotalea insulae]GLX79767.1 transcriptional regulator [Thalassotalea insulae]